MTLTPLLKRSLAIGAVVLLGLLVLRYFAAAPTVEHDEQRGVGAPP
jgi:hypothetical protein